MLPFVDSQSSSKKSTFLGGRWPRFHAGGFHGRHGSTPVARARKTRSWPGQAQRTGRCWGGRFRRKGRWLGSWRGTQRRRRLLRRCGGRARLDGSGTLRNGRRRGWRSTAELRRQGPGAVSGRGCRRWGAAILAGACWWRSVYMGITSSRALAGCEGTEDRYHCGRARGVSRTGAGLGRRR